MIVAGARNSTVCNVISIIQNSFKTPSINQNCANNIISLLGFFEIYCQI